MHQNRFSHFAFLTATITCLAASADASAQIYFGRGRGLIINVPGTAIRVGPLGAYGPRPLVIVSPYGVNPLYGVPGYGPPRPLRRLAARPTTPSAITSAQELPTNGELRAMSDSDLLNTTARVAGQLDADLGQFTTALGWRQHLRLPDDALPPPTDDGRVVLSSKSLNEMINRFDAAQADPQYYQITGLPTYSVVHSALKEIVRRYGESGSSSAAVAERSSSRSIEMQNLSKAPTGASSGRQVSQRIVPGPADDADDEPIAEELPMPPPAVTPPKNGPALVAPTNGHEVASEHSILSK
jgi:hypothetical protein